MLWSKFWVSVLWCTRLVIWSPLVDTLVRCWAAKGCSYSFRYRMDIVWPDKITMLLCVWCFAPCQVRYWGIQVVDIKIKPFCYIWCLKAFILPLSSSIDTICTHSHLFKIFSPPSFFSSCYNTLVIWQVFT